MNLNTRSVALATAALGLLALGLIGWQIATRQPASQSGEAAEAPSTTASGLVTGVAPPLALPSPASTDASAPPALVPVAPPNSGSVAAASKPAVTVADHKPVAATAPTIKHRVAPRPATQPQILPNEVDRVVGQALGSKPLARYFYLDPLARRFVATVDGLGQQPAPKTLWLLKPARGTLKLTEPQGKPPTPRVSSLNSRRYAGFVRWVERTDTAKLVALYARMYPLLQQTYVELGHPDGYFNDRLIEVIDQLLATPAVKAPLRVKPITLEPAGESSTPQRPRYELINPQLEQLTTGQKMLLRVGPQQAERLKVKLRALRAGLVKLDR
jgi:hypothetical protein